MESELRAGGWKERRGKKVVAESRVDTHGHVPLTPTASLSKRPSASGNRAERVSLGVNEAYKWAANGEAVLQERRTRVGDHTVDVVPTIKARNISETSTKGASA